jgi:hypothetical protein
MDWLSVAGAVASVMALVVGWLVHQEVDINANVRAVGSLRPTYPAARAVFHRFVTAQRR